MRIDVANEIQKIKDVRLINKSEMARRFGCNRRTIDRYLEGGVSKRKSRAINSVLDSYKEIVIDKVDSHGSSSMAAYTFIRDEAGYKGGYHTVNNFVKKHKGEQQHKATIRFETFPGVQAQVDWKESVSMISKNGEVFKINIFLMVLGYSRMKFLKLTSDKTQETLFECMFEAFKYYQGIPQEILFDNMSTVVDRSSSNYRKVMLNKTFNAFAQDAGFLPLTCRPYRPKTKGKVETLAKLMNRLKAYNEEFETFEELSLIIDKFNDNLNNEISQGTNERPIDRFIKEKEHLNPLLSMDCIISYFYDEKLYKVSKESMITYKGKKYSVPIHLIGKRLSIEETDSELLIYYTKDLISCHRKSDKYLHYKRDHMHEILKSEALKYQSDDSIHEFIDNNLKSMDIFLE